MAEVVVPLTVRDLTDADLPACGWYGTATDLAYVAEAIRRARRGEVDYLAVCPPSGLPVAVGGVDYTKPPGAATIWQLSVQAELRSCGIGSVLIGALEQRARARGLGWVELGVDDNRSRPRGLYERLGYVVSGNEIGSWDQEAADGSTARYETRITLMRKQLT
ncbi:ribosomal protein S18 acetylase RimI-like enzyme [Kribbella sp. VKM Ac-2569]|uniref:GNAT family N-acetyltransferase n=1 Tax=Kribbella sp. VKM Ac-2569 TaxID=2512220 RepID=UPI00102AEF2A|nr:GNAT family N-acetyltransferase [Kribbella sp. VKM Ac-2569]RZT28405.1 ribosomal protein S18 acetylase RimI-like enzyme [Kribbella sp. VKM Ac-2569]